MIRKILLLAALVAVSSAHAEDLSPQLIGGVPVDKALWPSVVRASMGNAGCTATVVGERAVVFAAHCVSNRGAMTFRTIDGTQYSSVCSHHPEYRRNSTADWAWCVTNKKVEGVPYEIVNTDLNLYKVGDSLTILGYGCTQPGGTGGNDGILRMGDAIVTQLPRRNDYDTVTRGGAASCYGDSGGPTFVYLDAAKTKRVLVTVTSRGDIARWSYLVTLATQTSLDYAKTWAQSVGVQICGIHPEAQGCRGSDLPPPEELPVECRQLSTHLSKWSSCLTATIAPPKEECDAAHEKLDACYEARYP